ncbi:hypothetical protein [Planomonospora venezuelensis]|uniref:Uncharacterized protein n=1 Tax=Planomonospora venezuelensis TaxID=1999 RepID=A0A841D7L1_PLAVE|nr:hypothetical protein [Planomonospora venezuelensis]MBB5964487.1 hypothetical protein [Planomonospora venezuelensis]GIN04222.1 hypothetical protein Pve01_58800 [Planomonospora venezuelensis]
MSEPDAAPPPGAPREAGERGTGSGQAAARPSGEHATSGKPVPEARAGQRGGHGNQQWMFAMLPAFPLALLVVRLWYASRQDTQTLLLLVQHVSALGLLTAVLLTTLWVLPALVLTGRALGTLYRVSTARSSWLSAAADRIPDWVVVLSVMVGAVSWQLRFLPTLIALSLAVLGLTIHDRMPVRRDLIVVFTLLLPLVAAVGLYVWLAPAIGQALAERDVVTAVLLALPPGLAVLLTGPVPARAAAALTSTVAVAVLALAPLFTAAVVVEAPILPLMGLEISDEGADEEIAGKVLLGHVIATDDRVSTFLDRDGTVRFIPNGAVASQFLCPDLGQIPRSRVALNRWYVEHSVLAWFAPDPLEKPSDPRCPGRPTDPGKSREPGGPGRGEEPTAGTPRPPRSGGAPPLPGRHRTPASPDAA